MNSLSHSLGDKREKTFLFQYDGDVLESFYIKGGIMIAINPLEFDCYDCFNARLHLAEINFSADTSSHNQTMNFEIVHMGAEIFTIMEGGVRQITFVQNSPKERFKTYRYLNQKIIARESMTTSMLETVNVDDEIIYKSPTELCHQHHCDLEIHVKFLTLKRRLKFVTLLALKLMIHEVLSRNFW